MAATGTLHTAFISELRDTYDAERQILRALPRLVKAATTEDLRLAFETHLEETSTHIERLEEVFASLDERVRGKHCDGVAGILEEGKSILEEDFDEATMDAALIGAAQRVEHYEMAAYGTLVAWAKAMGHDHVAGLLEQTLEEEKTTDQRLSSLAEAGVNQAAAEWAHSVNGDADRGMDTRRSSGTAGSPRSGGRKTR
jgi:ferritin-like metal-binding protein YciE